jgi:hypothetical protein
MPRQKTVLILWVFILTLLCLNPAGIVAQDAKRISPDSNQATDNTLAGAKKELLDAASAHRVSIQADRMLYVSDGATTILHAPITGIERYRASDFEAGAPILLLIVKSTVRLAIPNGSYVVRAQYQSAASSGKATFTDRNGTVSAQRDLIVRTWKQSGILFPGVYTDPIPNEIPNITSTHFWIIKNGVKKWYVDCSGVNGTLIFETG